MLYFYRPAVENEVMNGNGQHNPPQQLIDQIQALPEDSLDDLTTYIAFRRFRTGKVREPGTTQERLRIVNLRGLLKGHDFILEQ